MQISDVISRASRFRREAAIIKYGASLLLVAVTLGVQLWLEGYIRGLRFLLFFPAILALSIAFGKRPAIVATVASAVGTLYFFVEPLGRFGLDDLAAASLAAIFIATGLFAVNIVDALLSTIARLAATTARLRQSEAEKALLLDEVNHRVKNNLQMIGSMLAMQGRSIADPHARRVLESVTARVAVMGRAHRRLEPTATDAMVDAHGFIGDLCEDLRETVIQHRPITLDVEVDPVALEVHRATNVGLIVNELLTNALKYAFPGDRAGTIRVRFASAHDGLFCLTVQDDGIGMGAGESTGFGLRLVQMLTRQLSGTVLIGPAEGVRTTIRFPASERERATEDLVA